MPIDVIDDWEIVGYGYFIISNIVTLLKINSECLSKWGIIVSFNPPKKITLIWIND